MKVITQGSKVTCDGCQMSSALTFYIDQTVKGIMTLCPSCHKQWMVFKTFEMWKAPANTDTEE